MGLFSIFHSAKPSFEFALECEGVDPIYKPDEPTLRDVIGKLGRGGPSFATLSSFTGDYVQCAGSRPWCVVESRKAKPAAHWRAFQSTPIPKYVDGAQIKTGAGDITMQSDEWFLLKDAVEIFVSFLTDTPFPDKVQWRSMNEII